MCFDAGSTEEDAIKTAILLLGSSDYSLGAMRRPVTVYSESEIDSLVIRTTISPLGMLSWSLDLRA